MLGAVSDALGRRRLLLAGSALFTVFSVVCAAAPDILVFDIARPLQGIAGGAQFVLSAVAAPLPGAFGNTTVLSTAVVVLGFVLLSVVALLVLARPWQGHGEPVGA
ncbi:MFS transporter [Sciscionella sediminilitoris]|uniref:MFS transporter n=1 Tax=Sciscionella sediminilitoris TaxID=1445613 RepID=UPI0004DF051E|nr:MFS transporter [Sciscionella sp. SE31]